ncbi:MAG: prenyltransferase/squalene oxidase repeat-containing protein [Methermicoccaceae archaeon]
MMVLQKIPLLLVVVVFILLMLAGTTVAYPLDKSNPDVANAIDYLKGEQDDDGSIGGYRNSEWVAMALVGLGEDPSKWNTTTSTTTLKDYILNNTDKLDDEGQETLAIERHILTLVAIGEDPTNSSGVNWVQRLGDEYRQGQIGDATLVNDDYWGVLALVSAGVDPSDSEIIQHSIDFIKNNQNSDGGWGIVLGGPSDTDDTAAAIMALISAGESQSSDEIKDGLDFIRDSQDDNGGFLSDPSFGGSASTEATSWVIGALLAVGEDPTSVEWTKSGNNPIDFLLTMTDNDGAFLHLAGVRATPEYSTAIALIALAGKYYPLVTSSSNIEEPEFTVEEPETTCWADKATARVGESITVSVFYLDPEDRRYKPLPGAEVKLGTDEVYITNSKGEVTIVLTKAGTYEIVASKTYYQTSDKFELTVLPPETQQEIELQDTLNALSEEDEQGSEPTLIEVSQHELEREAGNTHNNSEGGIHPENGNENEGGTEPANSVNPTNPAPGALLTLLSLTLPMAIHYIRRRP